MQDRRTEPWVSTDRWGRHLASLQGAGNPIAQLHAKTWALNKAPTEEQIREAYIAAGFSVAQLERAFKRKANWGALPDIVSVRFPKPVSSVLRQTEVLIPLDQGRGAGQST